MIELIKGTIQPYAWGSTTAIPELLGVQPTGEPQAELWFGAHPLSPSQLGGQPLDEVIEADPAGFIGSASVEKFGPRLPFLMKIIAAAQPLSLQAHPSREQAEAGYARENEAGIDREAPDRVYRDGWPKPEVMCALGDFDALCGFRDPIETYALFSALQIDQVLEIVEPLRWGGSEALEKAFARLLYARHPEMLVGATVLRCKELTGSDDAIGQFARTAVEIGRHYPVDPGVLAALMMNRLRLQRFDALYLPAGNLHAYLQGTGVEVMANSDNVMRGGLTPKHIDVEELLNTLDFTPGVPSFVPTEEVSPGVTAYRTPAPEFSFWRVEPNGGAAELPADGSGRIFMVTDGDLILKGPHAKVKLTHGESAFLKADGSRTTVSGTGVAFLGAPGV